MAKEHQTAKALMTALQQHADAGDAIFLQRFFKTGKGQYGAGDVFIGVRVPQTRTVCRQFKNLPLGEIEKLLASPVHEHRLAGVILLVSRYQAAKNDPERREVYEVYLGNVYAGRINNWDIVDGSAEFIVGEYLREHPSELLTTLARSGDLWQRRVAMLSTFAGIKRGESEQAFTIAQILLHDPHDLIQKAVGWMLREIGKRCNEQLLLDFLELEYTKMPRTTLRYAVERLSPSQRQHFMKKLG